MTPIFSSSKSLGLIILIALLASVFTVSPAWSSEGKSIEALTAQRLNLMKDVAAYKWIKQRPIEDLERERVVLNAAVENGLRHELKPDSTTAFFQVQIEAAKEIQLYWFKQWREHKQAAPITAPDLLRDIRPKLIHLGDEISLGLAQRKNLLGNGFKLPEGLSPLTLKKLLAAAKVERFANRLELILATKTLRVGTTGDYAPFSSDASSKQARLTGIDIELAEDLASALGVDIQWVETSWPTLMADLKSGMFDIGMSGISKNLQRARYAYFSPSYQIGGKAPIVRCEDRHKFTSLESIDQAAVRVVVNPGGTNHRFVKSNIKRARVLIHDDNRTIFQQLVQRKADVMITDHVEVLLQSANNKTLCPAPMSLLSHSEKAYLLPQDEALLNYVSTWLALRKNDGTVAAVKQKYLEGL